MDTKTLIDLIGGPQGPGWASTAACGLWLLRLSVRFGELQATVRSMANCTVAKCPNRETARSFPTLDFPPFSILKNEKKDHEK